MTDRDQDGFQVDFASSSLNEPGARSLRGRVPTDVRRWLRSRAAATPPVARDIEAEEGRSIEGEPQVNDDGLLKLFAGRVQSGDTIGAARALLQDLAPPDQLERVVERWRAEVRAPRELTDPLTMVDPDSLPEMWYRGPQDGQDRFWPMAVAAMQRDEFAEEDIESVDRATTKILSLTQPPGGGSMDCRGLVLGHVQSGKTTNFTGLIAKAADVGYRMVIILTGMAENLRVQTQLRINEALVEPDSDSWYETTSPLADFTHTSNAGYVLSRPDGLALAVVKKNPHRLRRLNKWLDQAGEATLRSCPILIIDDEADQASIDVSRDPDLPSRINSEIRTLLERPKTTYVGYTATPFANLLINPGQPTDLYPRDFIVDLPRPRRGSGYLGTEEVFGRLELPTDDGAGGADGLDMVRQIPEDEAGSLRPPRNREDREEWEPSVPSRMEAALRWFLLATSARRTRDARVRHSSMLIHTTLYTECQLQLRPHIERRLSDLRRGIEARDDALLGELREQWEDEMERVQPSDLGLAEVTFDDLEAELVRTARAATVYVDNYRSDDRIVYGDEPETAVVIGGNTLSRGLTLEGLVSSYFVRASTAYDTLLQMGRWFGYRKGWQDLPRIWMTGELWEWFTWLATVEEEIRRDVRRYETERLTPVEFAARIRKHPDLAITSALKMRGAVSASISYAQTRQQTILFNQRDEDWLEDNLKATKALMTAASARSAPEWQDGRALLKDVPAALVLEFLGSYRFHEDALHLRSDLIAQYVRRQNEHGRLTAWNVVVASVDTEPASGLDLGLDRNVGRVVRSRLDIRELPHANIKALMSRRDWLADAPEAYAGSMSLDDIWRTRRETFPDRGLLVVYPIDPESAPQRGKNRAALDAVKEVIGLGLVFPATDTVLDVNYVTANLDPGAIDEIEDLDVLTEESVA